MFGLSQKAWRHKSQARVREVREAVEENLPPTDAIEEKALQASLGPAAAAGVMPVRGFNIRGARCVHLTATTGGAKQQCMEPFRQF